MGTFKTVRMGLLS